jgi:hypothetical protein
MAYFFSFSPDLLINLTPLILVMFYITDIISFFSFFLLCVLVCRLFDAYDSCTYVISVVGLRVTVLVISNNKTTASPPPRPKSTLLLLFYSRLLFIRWRSSSKSRSQQEIKAIDPSTLQMTCAVLISVIFCSSIAEGWPGSNWRFRSNPF